jgi:hypothetical protein
MVTTKPSVGLAHTALVLLGGLYLVGVWLEGVGSSIPAAVLPRTPLYFLQIAALFPRASLNVIDYRAEAWLCKEHRWQEIDTRAYFPLDPDDKENRFQRVMHFFRDNRPTMRALDEYIVDKHADHDMTRPDGLPEGATLGGIRVLSLRLPIPDPSAPLTRTGRHPLAEYPKSVRKYFYHTPNSKRTERCGYHEKIEPPSEPEATPSRNTSPEPETEE